MKELTFTFRTGKQFLEHYSDDGRREKLFLPGVIDCSAGDEVHLKIHFKHSGYTFQSLAQVMLRRLAGKGPNLKPGALLCFIGPPFRNVMVAHARGEVIPYTQRSMPRVACSFPVTIVHRNQKVTAEAVDYCPGGVQIRGGPRLEIGDAVQIQLHPTGMLFRLRLWGQISWIQQRPELAYGVQLRPSGSFLRRRLQKLYERLLERRLG